MATNKRLTISELYKPYRPQKEFHSAPHKYRLYGGAAGGGKTHALIWESILRCIKHKFPVTGALFRRSFPELESTIIRGMQEILPEWFYSYNQNKHVLTLATKDVIDFGYCETDNDVIRYQSVQWDFLGIDELTHHTEYRFLYLNSRVRSTKSLNTKFFAATNPGGIGHAWVKSRWVTKDCNHPKYRPEEYKFIPAKVTDNLVLMKTDPTYIENLKMLPEAEKKALLYGDWDVFEGQFFSDWSYAKHVVRQFEVPESWRLILGWDDGERAPRSVHLYAIDNDQRVWVIWEYYKAKENLYDAAHNIKDELQKLGYWERIFKLVVDPSMKKKSTQTGITSIEILEGLGFGFQVGKIELGNNDRVAGWRVMKSYMTFTPYEEPLLKVMDICPEFIRTVPELVYYQGSGGRGNKREDLDTTLEDHAADECRYVLMSLDSMPSRFQGGVQSKFDVLKKLYKPRSIFS